MIAQNFVKWVENFSNKNSLYFIEILRFSLFSVQRGRELHDDCVKMTNLNMKIPSYKSVPKCTVKTNYSYLKFKFLRMISVTVQGAPADSKQYNLYQLR